MYSSLWGEPTATFYDTDSDDDADAISDYALGGAAVTMTAPIMADSGGHRMFDLSSHDARAKVGVPSAVIDLLTRTAFEKKPTVVVSSSASAVEEDDNEDDMSGERCAICLETLEPGVAVFQLKCQHTYHTQCLIPWLSEHTTCPMRCGPVVSLQTVVDRLDATIIRTKDVQRYIEAITEQPTRPTIQSTTTTTTTSTRTSFLPSADHQLHTSTSSSSSSATTTDEETDEDHEGVDNMRVHDWMFEVMRDDDDGLVEGYTLAMPVPMAPLRLAPTTNSASGALDTIRSALGHMGFTPLQQQPRRRQQRSPPTSAPAISVKPPNTLPQGIEALLAPFQAYIKTEEPCGSVREALGLPVSTTLS